MTNVEAMAVPYNENHIVDVVLNRMLTNMHILFFDNDPAFAEQFSDIMAQRGIDVRRWNWQDLDISRYSALREEPAAIITDFTLPSAFNQALVHALLLPDNCNVPLVILSPTAPDRRHFKGMTRASHIAIQPITPRSLGALMLATLTRVYKPT